MKIVLVNTYDAGGAANACKRLHLGLLDENVNSNVLLRSKYFNWPCSYQFQNQVKATFFLERIKSKIFRAVKRAGYDRLANKLASQKKIIKTRDQRLELFSFPDSEFDITQSPLYQEADIINLHWVAEFLDYDTFFRKNTKPVIWTLHDMNPFRGGEHYLENLLGMDHEVPRPREFSERELKIEKQLIQHKKRIISKINNLTIVTPSKWLMKEAQRSEVFEGRPVVHIPYGLDPEIFKLKDKLFCREKLDLPKDKKIILFVADSLGKYRKGYDFLKKAFEMLSVENIFLCAVGATDNKEPDSISNLVEFGSVSDERTMCDIYNAADVFVIPSLMDNLPNTVLESIMCGTPVIGFPVGGIKDMIQNGQNGFLTTEISVTSLAETITYYLELRNDLDREAIRKNAVKLYSQERQAKKYIQLYRDVLEK